MGVLQLGKLCRTGSSTGTGLGTCALEDGLIKVCDLTAQEGCGYSYKCENDKAIMSS